MTHALDMANDGFNIAVIGMAGRFPGAGSVAEFWENLRAGRESISFFSEEELLGSGVAPKLLEDRRFVRAGAVIPNAFDFDAAFFDINRVEAELMDPQHRLFLECAWEALEEAGYDTEQYRGEVGVYGGVSFHPYLWSNLWGREADPLDTHLLKINLGGSLTGRVSYKLNLKGPSLTLQSGCSTSLVAVHLACQSLLGYECDMALAGGVSVDADAKGYFVQEGALSPDGHTRAFDAKAQGVVGGNGVGVVVLKRLADALNEGDHIYAVIKGSAINNDGSLKIGYTAPSVQGQVRAIMAAQLVAGVEAGTINYIEAHGTGTPLGDSIELKALTEAFRATTARKQFCAIGSVKTNVGHLDNAAGVTGLIKTALALHHRLLPPSLHFESPNPEFDLLASPFYVNTAATEWTNGSTPRRASVSSFGIGGTNAHAVLEEAPKAEPTGDSRSWQLLTVSARTAPALETLTSQLVDYLKLYPEQKLADIAYTCHVGRRAFNHRRMLVCSDGEDAVRSLEALTPQRVFTATQEAINRPLAFMFPGGGAQYLQMGRGIYNEERVFREQMDACAELLHPELGFDLRGVLYADTETEMEAARVRLASPACAMSASFAVEYALASLYISWGVRPAAMIGHSFGEYVAAALAGVLSLRDALRLIALRGQLFVQMDEGAMLSVPLPEDEIEPLLGEHLSLAAVNGPSRCVLSGPPSAIAAVERLLGERKVSTSRLQVNRAGHSRMVDPILEQFSQLISGFRLQPPAIPFISNVTGTWITSSQATDPDYWMNHLRQTVRFGDGIGELVKEPSRILLEVGPGQILSSLARRQLTSKRTQLALASLPDPQDKREDMAFLLTTLGKLWLAGVNVKWDSFYADEKRRRLSLPTYPFERQSYRRAARQTAVLEETVKPAKSAEAVVRFYTPGWRRQPITQHLSPGIYALQEPILLFIDEGGPGEILLKRLWEAGRAAIAVRAGETFARLSEREYTINPQAPADYRTLLKEINALGPSRYRIVYQWGPGSPADDSFESALPEESRANGYSNLLYLVAAARAEQPSTPVELLLITSDTQEVTGDEPLRPGRAMTAGACAALSDNASLLSCRSVDVEACKPGELREERLLEQLLAEIDASATQSQVAYRGPYRWVQTYEQIMTEGAAPQSSMLREGGVYLIINGTEGPGLGLAEHLAKNASAKLILTTSPANNSEPRSEGRLQVNLAGETERITGWEEEIDEALSIQPIKSYAGLEENFNALCAGYIYAFLNSGPVELKKGASLSLEELRSGLEIQDRFKHFLDLFLLELSRDGIVELKAQTVEFLKEPSEVGDPEQLKEELSRRYPQFASSFWLLEHCVKSYGRVFSGEISPGSVLYPNGSYEMLQSLADSSVETSKSRVYRELVAKVISGLASRSARKLRILEVGAGTGLVTELVLNSLAGAGVEYHFTDIGRSFVLEAEKQETWKSQAEMRYGVLDISEDPIAQGFDKDSYDIIVAFDVVQATKDVTKSLGHLRSLLAPGGALFMLQTLKAFRWQHLTFGLSPGWWNFRDDPLRGSSPVMSLAQWEAALYRQGFSCVQSYPRRAADDDAEFGMVVAQREAESKLPAISVEGEATSRGVASSLKALENLGAEVLVETLEAARPEQLREVVELARRRFKEINGIFYTVSAQAGSDITTVDSSAPSGHSAPYLSERRQLHSLVEALQEASPDFCMLFAPSASTAQRVDEAALRRFMEAFVDEQNRKSSRPFWLCSSLDPELCKASGSRESLTGPEEAEAALQRLFSLKRVAPHIYVSKEEPGRSCATPLEAVRAEGAVVGSNGHRQSSNGKNGLGGAQEGSQAEQQLAALWKELLGVKEVGRDDSFFDLGGDSLIALQLVSRVRDAMRVDIAIADLFERQTLGELAELIAQPLSGAGPQLEPFEFSALERGGDDMEHLLAQLEQFSDEEVKALLQEGTEPLAG